MSPLCGQLMATTCCLVAVINLWSCGVWAEGPCWRLTAVMDTRFWMLTGERIVTSSSSVPGSKRGSQFVINECNLQMCDKSKTYYRDLHLLQPSNYLFLSSALSTVPMTTVQFAPAALIRQWSCGMLPRVRWHANSEVMLGSVLSV